MKENSFNIDAKELVDRCIKIFSDIRDSNKKLGMGERIYGSMFESLALSIIDSILTEVFDMLQKDTDGEEYLKFFNEVEEKIKNSAIFLHVQDTEKENEMRNTVIDWRPISELQEDKRLYFNMILAKIDNDRPEKYRLFMGFLSPGDSDVFIYVPGERILLSESSFTHFAYIDNYPKE
jgi:hypothetical protein